jgi:hypothetical protein
MTFQPYFILEEPAKRQRDLPVLITLAPGGNVRAYRNTLRRISIKQAISRRLSVSGFALRLADGMVPSLGQAGACSRHR